MDEPILVVDAETGNAVLKDGMPLYKYPDGTEQPLNLAETIKSNEQRVANLEEEKNRHFETRQKIEQKLQAYGKITPEVAKEYQATVKKLEGKKLYDEHGLEEYQKQWTGEITANINEEWQTKESTWQETENGLKQEIADMDKIIFDLAVNNKLGTHPYFSGEKPKTVFRPSDAAKIYGDRFQVERDGTKLKVQALDRDGKVLLSKKNHGVPAEFDEAVELIVQQDNDGNYEIFKGSNISGPSITGNMDPGGPNAEEGSKPVDLIKSGLKKHNRAMHSG
jgi:hypothetical protein